MSASTGFPRGPRTGDTGTGGASQENAGLAAAGLPCRVVVVVVRVSCSRCAFVHCKIPGTGEISSLPEEVDDLHVGGGGRDE